MKDLSVKRHDRGIFRTVVKSIPILLLSLGPVQGAQAEDLLEIFRLAAERDPEIRQARANYQANHTLLAQGRSQLLPTVSLSASTSRDTTGTDGEAPPTEDGSPFGRQQPHSFGNSFNSKNYGLSIRQNLLNFEAWYAYQAARENDKAAALNLAEAEQELIMRVSTAYFDVLQSQDNLETFRAEEEATARLLEQSEERFEVGLVPITDVYESQANYDLARVNRLVEENNLNQRYEALEAITGLDHQNLAPLEEEFPVDGLDENMDLWVQVAMENNLGIRAAEKNLSASEQEAKAARAAMLPTMDVSASYNWSQSGNTFSFFGPNLANESTGISLNISVPIFSGGLNSAQKRQAYYARNATEEALMLTRRSSIQTVRNSYRSIETDVQAVAAREQAIESAQSALEATEVGLEVGTRNVVDVVLAQRTLFQSQRDYDTARYNYILNTLNLKQAAGTLSPQDIMELNDWLNENEAQQETAE